MGIFGSRYQLPLFSCTEEVFDDIECPICLDIVYDSKRGIVKKGRRLHCGHLFCDRCITLWEAKSNKCPVCRGEE